MSYTSIIKNFSMTPYIHADIVLRNEPIKLKLTKQELFHKYPLESAYLHMSSDWKKWVQLSTGKIITSDNPYVDIPYGKRVYSNFSRNVYQLIKPNKIAVYRITFNIPKGKSADDIRRYWDFEYTVTHITVIEKWGATCFSTRLYLDNDSDKTFDCSGDEYKFKKDLDNLYYLTSSWLYQVSRKDIEAMLQFIGAPDTIYAHDGMSADTIVSSIIRNARASGINPNTLSPTELYQDILNRPVPDWEALKEEYHYTTQYPTIAERIGDTICLTIKGYGEHVYRYILNKKHSSIFKQYETNWEKVNSGSCTPRSAHIINWSHEISEGTLAQKLGRAKYFGEAIDNVEMIRAMFQRAKHLANRDHREEERLQDIIQLLDMDAFYKAMQGATLRTLHFTNTYGQTVEFRDIFTQYISYSHRLVCDPSAKDIYARHGISKGQLKTLLSLYEGEDGFGSSTVRNIIDGLATVVSHGQTKIDFRGFDPIKFNKYVEYCKKLKCSPLNSYNTPPLPEECDHFKMIEFWMNHNYTSSDLQILRDYILMHQRLNPDTPLTLEDYKIKDLEDLRRRHDRLVIAQKEFNDKSFAEKWAMQKPKWEKFCYKDKDFEIIAPESGEEVIAEGRILDHCVGGYVDRIAKGETIILFMRKRSDPQKPFYTLNISPDGTRLIQVHGYKNRWPATDPETLPFLDKWVEKLDLQGWDYIRSVNRDHY